ncbi:MAG: hypothetical protein DHS20C02_17420 [Micavibrio sp.]|nr:MAG: hypothetical protein DHS20C02_17420 [Micavibrio sp.]
MVIWGMEIHLIFTRMVNTFRRVEKAPKEGESQDKPDDDKAATARENSLANHVGKNLDIKG